MRVPSGGEASWNEGGQISMYGPRYSPLSGSGSSPSRSQSRAVSGAARSRQAWGRSRPKLCCADGTPSAAATGGAARSAVSWTISSGCHAVASASSASSFAGPSSVAKRNENVSGRRSCGGTCFDPDAERGHLRCEFVEAGTGRKILEPASATRSVQLAAVEYTMWCPAAANARASGTVGMKCPSPAVQLKRTRIRRSSRFCRAVVH